SQRLRTLGGVGLGVRARGGLDQLARRLGRLNRANGHHRNSKHSDAPPQNSKHVPVLPTGVKLTLVVCRAVRISSTAITDFPCSFLSAPRLACSLARRQASNGRRDNRRHREGSRCHFSRRPFLVGPPG